MMEKEIESFIEGCRRQNRADQQRLYARCYNYAMNIARRYAGNQETAEEVVNDSFFKVFTKIDQYDARQPFRFWLRRIIINSAIDRLRSSLNSKPTVEMPDWYDPEDDAGIIEKLTKEQIFNMLDHLSPAYRTVFNLYVIEGFSHDEIAASLGIGVSGSKSNLSRARAHIRQLLIHDFDFKFNNNITI